ncbi:MAG TPA: hypothetical protein VN030_13735 [Cellvibrio sp.]|nr:hypothetical protein [Cellvibrio sp.]
MKKSTKAALYSALIFPGAGLYLLKHYVRGNVFLLPALAAILYVIYGITTVTRELSEKVAQNPNAFLDISKLSSDISASIAVHIPFYHQAISLFVLSWIISTISSYFAGKKQELDDTKAPVGK